ncbi:hypothetical protein JYG23_13555 [Sedimentibacter sp. zth1]|uniref:DUF7670 domain-containing protein n=1 Tax=Sedimentibacter sp. zth1 TaxID=2816908 RepID=UPI001A91DE8E|nr:hypothetical protein [Sedimentibacter sp. zth1]QSX05673.1 hypothetical protein JYG23_13555 [Sedimentibacter sp. zth1]
MKNNISKYDRKLKIVRWIARVIGSLSTAFFLFMIIGDLMFISEPYTLEGVMVVGFAIVLTVGVLIAWWKEGIGGVILTISAIAFAMFIYFTAGRYKVLASVLISSPFLISGVLFLITRHKK